MMNFLQLSTVLFSNKISHKDISCFRGAMIHLSNNSPLFHNHKEDGLSYVYPLVQYKRINGNAALVGLNKGAEVLEDLFDKKNSFCCQLGTRMIELELLSIRTEKCVVGSFDSEYLYEIHDWLPLNGDNYKKYLQEDSLVKRIDLLEKILVGNILSFGRGTNISFDNSVFCQILEVQDKGLILYKHVELMSFSVVFRSNVYLPEYIGLGKAASVNHGLITHV